MDKFLNLIKGVTFIIIVAAVLYGLGLFLSPKWKECNNYDTYKGFYEQKENTINTISLGASVVVYDISPMELYDEYGICAYNLGDAQQPMYASYYWLQEAYRKHSESLSNVVLDLSMLRYVPESGPYQKAVDSMEISGVKLRALQDYTDNTNDLISYLFPVLEYHNRWNQINKSDFDKFEYTVDAYRRGYSMESQQRILTEEVSEIAAGNESGNMDDESEEIKFNREELIYFGKIVTFCNEHNLDLVLIKTWQQYWTEDDHNAAQQIADSYQLDLIDMNVEPYKEEVGLNYATDFIDESHANYYGALKTTSVIGKYLEEKGRVVDVRDDPNYSFLISDKEKYDKEVEEKITYKEIDNVKDYLQYAMNDDDNVIFISVKDDASYSLTEQQKEYFKSIGLNNLSELEFRGSYIGIIQNNNVIIDISDYGSEYTDEDIEETSELSNLDIINGSADAENPFETEEIDEETDEEIYLCEQGKLSTKDTYTIKSGGAELGNISSIMVNGVEYSPNSRGLNIVVYNPNSHSVVSARVFDTHQYSEQKEIIKSNDIDEDVDFSNLEPNLQKLFLYNRKCEASKLHTSMQSVVEKRDFLTYINTYSERDNTTIFLSVCDEASVFLEKYSKKELRNRGLQILSNLSSNESYIAEIYNGSVAYEQADSGNTPISKSHVGYEIISGGANSGSISSILIDGIEYSPNSRGINVVVYDELLKSVISTAVFDTNEE